MKNIRVLVVDDSYFMRKLISDLINDSGIAKVIDTAKNGVEAIEKVKHLSPDVVTMDVEMPTMNGIEALQYLMKHHPVPVIMLSSLTKEGTETTIQALQLGAFDFIAKPSGSISFDIKKVQNEIIDKILIAAKEKEKWTRQWNIKDRTKTAKTIIFPEKKERNPEGILAIGTSTGGPKALHEVVTKIPKHFPYAVLIVQHMPARFTKSLADRLNGLSMIDVVEAEDKQEIQAGTAYIAPGNYHMTVQKNLNTYQIKLDQSEPIAGHRPSVDNLFQSLAVINLHKIFVVMTGMGSDGTKGLKAGKQVKDYMIAEDESTCIVFGMPKSAIKSGLVDKVVPLHHIPDEILRAVEKQRGWQSWK